MRIQYTGTVPMALGLEAGEINVTPGDVIECTDRDWQSLEPTGAFQPVPTSEQEPTKQED